MRKARIDLQRCVLHSIFADRRPAAPIGTIGDLCARPGEIVCIRVHFVAVPRLVGAPVPPPVMRDDAIAMLPKERHLPVPVVRGQWPAMRKHDRVSLSPALIVNLRAVFGRDRAHSLNGTVTQSYRIQHHIPALPCLRLAETLQGTSEAFVLPKTPARR